MFGAAIWAAHPSRDVAPLLAEQKKEPGTWAAGKKKNLVPGQLYLGSSCVLSNHLDDTKYLVITRCYNLFWVSQTTLKYPRLSGQHHGSAALVGKQLAQQRVGRETTDNVYP